MDEVRSTFLEAARAASKLLSSAAVADRWDSDSVLREFSVRGLAGHLVRGATSVIYYLDSGAAEGDDEPLSAPAYYAAAVGDDVDVGSELHRAIRDRGEKEAAGGHEELVERMDRATDELAARLETLPADQQIQVLKGMVLRLDDYLVTRVIELVVHMDDLALSVDEPVPQMSDAAMDLCIRTLVDVGRHRHGDLAVLRALSRRERDTIEALRVL